MFMLLRMLAFALPRPAEFLYAGLGILSSVAFIIAGVLDFLDEEHTTGLLFLLFIFAVWNGFGSISALRSLLRHS